MFPIFVMLCELFVFCVCLGVFGVLSVLSVLGVLSVLVVLSVSII